MATSVHATAFVDTKAELDSGVEIGPYCCVGPNVQLSAGVVLHPHVVLDGHTTIGPRTRIFPFASIGMQPQDLKYAGEPSRLIIGADNTIREQVTMNPGTEGGGMETRVGDHCAFMIGVHIAHDCIVGDHVIMANNATLGGHVTIGDHAVIGGLAAIHQFVRIGAHAMIGGMTGVENDVIPYGSVIGERGRLSGLNVVGLRRRGFTKDQVRRLRAAYQLLFVGDQEGAISDRMERVVEEYGDAHEVMEMVEFMRADSPRGLTPPKRGNGE